MHEVWISNVDPPQKKRILFAILHLKGTPLIFIYLFVYFYLVIYFTITKCILICLENYSNYILKIFKEVKISCIKLFKKKFYDHDLLWYDLGFYDDQEKEI